MDDREACLSVDVLFREVDVSLECGVDGVYVGWAGTEVGGDEDEDVWMGCVLYALFGEEFGWREGEFDGGGKGQTRRRRKKRAVARGN